MILRGREETFPEQTTWPAISEQVFEAFQIRITPGALKHRYRAYQKEQAALEQIAAPAPAQLPDDMTQSNDAHLPATPTHLPTTQSQSGDARGVQEADSTSALAPATDDMTQSNSNGTAVTRYDNELEQARNGVVQAVHRLFEQLA